jgi:hypothetical protein
LLLISYFYLLKLDTTVTEKEIPVAEVLPPQVWSKGTSTNENTWSKPLAVGSARRSVAKQMRLRFPRLRSFAAGIAIVMPTSRVEAADFSLLKYRKDEFNSSLSDFPLEGVMYCR